MPLQHVSFACGSCGLAFETDLGTPPGNARISDAQPEGPYYRAFWCRREGKLHQLDVTKATFAGRCPGCRDQLLLLADFPLDSCPRCFAPAGVEKTRRRGSPMSRA